MSDTQGTGWAVVGGGVLGMTLAHRLAKSGGRVTLIEASGHLGGMADAWKLGDVTWDRHYHVILLSDTRLRSLLAELGLETEIEWGETKTGFYCDGSLHSMSNTLEFLRFEPLGLIDKFRLGMTIFYASKIKNPRRLEKIPVADWLRRLSGKRTFEKIWLPLLRAKLGDNYQKTSAAFIWATIARMYAARRTGLKKEMFGYVRGGYGRIIDRMEESLVSLGVTIRKNCPVKRVTPAVGDGVEITLSDDCQETFDRVVITAPAPVAARMCPQLSTEERERLEAIEYQGILCASVLLKRPLADYYVTNVTDSWVPFTGVIEMTALVDPECLGGHRLVYLPKYVDSGDRAFELSDEEIADSFLGALDRMYPDFDRGDVIEFRVSRVRHVMALPTLNYSDSVPRMKTSLPGIHTVNSAQITSGTLNVNETIGLAEQALGEFGLSGQ